MKSHFSSRFSPGIANIFKEDKSYGHLRAQKS
jgi:hypothetical protein